MTIYIDEFLYRGRAPGDPEAPAWHVTLVDIGVDAFGRPRRSERQLNMQAAIDAGYDLTTILAGINVATGAALDVAQATVATLTAEKEEAVAQIAQLQALVGQPATSAVTPVQARKALNQAGLREAVEGWVAKQSQDVRDTWEFATDIHRDNPIIALASSALGMTDQQIDDLFALAKTL